MVCVKGLGLHYTNPVRQGERGACVCVVVVWCYVCVCSIYG